MTLPTISRHAFIHRHIVLGLCTGLFAAMAVDQQLHASQVPGRNTSSFESVSQQADAPAQKNTPSETLTNDGSSEEPGGTALEKASCVVCPVPGWITLFESEPCGGNSNQGCPIQNPLLNTEMIECNQARCGTFWVSANSRDVDMYRFTLSACTCITWTVDSQVAVEIGLLYAPGNPLGTGCTQVVPPQSGTCHTSLSACLAAGTYYLFVMPSFSNPVFDCNSPLRFYAGKLACTPCPPPPTSVCCESGVQPYQIIELVSGQVNGVPGSPGGVDDSVKYDAASSSNCTGGTMNGNYAGMVLPFTTATSAANVVAKHPAWLTTLVGPNKVPSARWINSTSNPIMDPPYSPNPGQTVLYYHPFIVSTPRPPKNACLTLTFAVDDSLGDPSGPLTSGIYLHHGALNSSNPPVSKPISGGTYNSQSTQTVYLGPGDLALGANRLFLYQTNVNNNPGCQASGIIYHAQIEICELCAIGDINCSGHVDVNDLLSVINNWGNCSTTSGGCSADVAPLPSGDGSVNILDLLMVITHWG